jgi:hypothetical protein
MHGERFGSQHVAKECGSADCVIATPQCGQMDGFGSGFAMRSRFSRPGTDHQFPIRRGLSASSCYTLQADQRIRWRNADGRVLIPENCVSPLLNGLVTIREFDAYQSKCECLDPQILEERFLRWRRRLRTLYRIPGGTRPLHGLQAAEKRSMVRVVEGYGFRIAVYILMRFTYLGVRLWL